MGGVTNLVKYFMMGDLDEATVQINISYVCVRASVPQEYTAEVVLVQFC